MPTFDSRVMASMAEMSRAMGMPGSFATYDPVFPTKTLQSLLEDGAALRVLADEYEVHEIPEPEWLTEKLKRLGREIKAAHRREQEERLARLEAEVKELRSKEEKRVAAEEEIARLKQALGA